MGEWACPRKVFYRLLFPLFCKRMRIRCAFVIYSFVDNNTGMRVERTTLTVLRLSGWQEEGLYEALSPQTWPFLILFVVHTYVWQSCRRLLRLLVNTFDRCGRICKTHPCYRHSRRRVVSSSFLLLFCITKILLRVWLIDDFLCCTLIPVCQSLPPHMYTLIYILRIFYNFAHVYEMIIKTNFNWPSQRDDFHYPHKPQLKTQCALN